MRRYLTDEQVRTIIEDLVGTCLTSVSQEVMDLGLDPDEMTERDWDAIDSEIFECDICGWWCSTDELNDTDNGMICDNCAEDYENS